MNFSRLGFSAILVGVLQAGAAQALTVTANYTYLAMEARASAVQGSTSNYFDRESHIRRGSDISDRSISLMGGHQSGDNSVSVTGVMSA